MTEEKKPEKTLLDKILSMETLIFLAGIFSLGSGFYTGEPLQYFWGGIIMTGSVALYFVKRKDWKKHWEEQEELHRRYQERQQAQKKEGGNEQ